MNTQSTKPKTKIELNMSNLHAVSQLSAAHKGVMTCARMGLTVVNVSLGGQIPTLEVQPNYVTASLLKNGRAVVYACHRARKSACPAVGWCLRLSGKLRSSTNKKEK